MSWDLGNVRKGLKAALTDLPIRVNEYIPAKVHPPEAFISTGAGEIETFDDAATIELVLLVLVSPTETAAAQRRLDEFVSTNTVRSIDKALKAAPTLPYAGVATVSFAAVTAWDEPAKYEIAGVEYYGVQFRIACMVQ